MQYARFAQQLASEVKPAYALKGDDYQAAKALAALTALADPYEVNVFTPLEDAKDALTALDSFPMFGSRRVVVLQDIASFAESERRAFDAYCAAPSLTSVLVFYRCGWAPAAAESCSFDHLKADAMVDALAEICESRGLTARRSALSLLVNYCGEDLGRAEAELTKLASYAGASPIDEDTVRAVTTADPAYQVYTFTDFISRGNYVGAHRVLDSLSSGNDQALFLGLLINHYRRALYGRISGLEPAELGKLLGNCKPFTITKAVESARHYSAKALLTLLQKLYRLEYDFKSGRMGASEALDLAIAEAIERRNS